MEKKNEKDKGGQSYPKQSLEFKFSVFWNSTKVKKKEKREKGPKQSVGVLSATWLGTNLVSYWKESSARKAFSQKETQIQHNFRSVGSQIEGL